MLVKKNNILEFLRFVLVGVLATAIHYGIYLLLINRINPTLAYTIGYLSSLVCNFFLSALFTFKTTANPKKGVGFLISHLINYLLQTGLLNLLIALDTNPKYAPLYVFVVIFPINFILVRTVFKSQKFQ